MCLSLVGVAYILGLLLVACIIWLRQIPYHVHVGLQVEVHVNYLLLHLLTGRACSITGREMDFHKFATLFKYRKISPTAYIFQRPFLRSLWRG